MLIDFKKEILNLKNEPLKLPDGSKLLLGGVCEEALMGNFPDESGLSGADKVKRFGLAIKISKEFLPIEITIEEAAELKRLVAKAYGPLVVGRAWEALEEAGAKKDL